MDQSQAKAVVATILSVGEHLSGLRDLSDRLPNDADKKEFRRHLGAAMAALNVDLLIPVIREHPDLDPDK